MISLWLCLVATYAGLSVAVGVPFLVALALAVFMASLTVATASLVRLVFWCSLESALVAAVAWMCTLHIALLLLGAQSGNFNARIGEHVTWIDGSPTAAGLWGIVYTVAAITFATFAAYVLMRAAGRVVRWLLGIPAGE